MHRGHHVHRKVLMQTHSEGPAVAADDLLIENEKLQAKNTP